MVMDKHLISLTWGKSQVNTLQLYTYEACVTERCIRPVFLFLGRPVPPYHCGCSAGVSSWLSRISPSPLLVRANFANQSCWSYREGMASSSGVEPGLSSSPELH